MKVGLIGCGKISHHYARAIKAMGDEVSAVAARTNSERLQNFSQAFPEAKVFYSWEKMLQDAKLDALILCISWDQIEKIAADIIKTNIPVLIEKPLALSKQQAQTILNEVNEYQNQVMIGYNRRFYKGITYLKKKLKKTNPLSVDFEIPDASTSIIKQKGKEIEPYIPYYMTSHWIDLIHYTLGEIKLKSGHKIQNTTGKFKGYYGLYESADSNFPITFRLNYDSPAKISFKYIFEDETLHFQPIEHLICSDRLEKTQDSKGNNLYRPHIKQEIVEDSEFKPGFINMLTEFKLGFVEKKIPPTTGARLSDVVWINSFIEEILN